MNCLWQSPVAELPAESTSDVVLSAEVLAARPTVSIGGRVSIRQGRFFRDFGAGDAGIVLRVDADSGQCEVVFDGRTTPLTVSMRHLEPQLPKNQETRSQEVPGHTFIQLDDDHHDAAFRRHASASPPRFGGLETSRESSPPSFSEVRRNDQEEGYNASLQGKQEHASSWIAHRFERQEALPNERFQLAEASDAVLPEYRSLRMPRSCSDLISIEVEKTSAPNDAGRLVEDDAQLLDGGEKPTHVANSGSSSRGSEATQILPTEAVDAKSDSALPPRSAVATVALAVVEVASMRMALDELRDLVIREIEARTTSFQEVERAVAQLAAGCYEYHSSGGSLMQERCAVQRDHPSSKNHFTCVSGPEELETLRTCEQRVKVLDKCVAALADRVAALAKAHWKATCDLSQHYMNSMSHGDAEDSHKPLPRSTDDTAAGETIDIERKQWENRFDALSLRVDALTERRHMQLEFDKHVEDILMQWERRFENLQREVHGLCQQQSIQQQRMESAFALWEDRFQQLHFTENPRGASGMDFEVKVKSTDGQEGSCSSLHFNSALRSHPQSISSGVPQCRQGMVESKSGKTPQILA